MPQGSSSARPRPRAQSVGLALGAVALVQALCAPLRRLSFDEAYYLCAAQRGPRPWPIDDHPPLIGALLAFADRVLPGPVELRVRLVAVVLQLLTALALVRTARALAPEQPARASWNAFVLGMLGVMPMAGGLLATPDAPLLASLAWILALCAERQNRQDFALCPLATLAVLAKVSAIPVLAALSVAMARRSPRRASLLGIGTLAALPLALPSLGLQLAHALGRGPATSAPELGPVIALLAMLAGQLALHSPPVVVLALRAHRRLGALPGTRLAALTLAVLVVLSALVSGRPPEPNWLAPAALPLLVACAVDLAHRPRAWALALYALPGIIGLLLWIAPFERGPFARVPRAHAEPPAEQAPSYARPAWRCVYEHHCEEIDAMFAGSKLRVNVLDQTLP